MDALRNTLRRYLVDEPYRRLAPDELWARFRDDRDEAALRVLLGRVGGRVYARWPKGCSPAGSRLLVTRLGRG